MKGGLDAAYNNLARLNIVVNKDYSGAAAMLISGLDIVKDDRVKYDMLKNLAWARVNQLRFSEAETNARDAISLDGNRAPGYCLLAQALDGEGDTQGALEPWNNCLKYANSRNPDEDMWIGMARASPDCYRRSTMKRILFTIALLGILVLSSCNFPGLSSRKPTTQGGITGLKPAGAGCRNRWTFKRSEWNSYTSTSLGASLYAGDQIRPAKGAKAVVLCEGLTQWTVPTGAPARAEQRLPADQTTHLNSRRQPHRRDARRQRPTDPLYYQPAQDAPVEPHAGLTLEPGARRQQLYGDVDHRQSGLGKYHQQIPAWFTRAARRCSQGSATC